MTHTKTLGAAAATLLMSLAVANAVPQVDYTSTDFFSSSYPAGDQVLLTDGTPIPANRAYAVFFSTDATIDYNPATPTTPGATDSYLGLYQVDPIGVDPGDIYGSSTVLMTGDGWTYIVAYDSLFSAGTGGLTGADFAVGHSLAVVDTAGTPGNDNYFYWSDGQQIQMVPEPGSLALLALGATVLAVRRRKQK